MGGQGGWSKAMVWLTAIVIAEAKHRKPARFNSKKIVAGALEENWRRGKIVGGGNQAQAEPG